MTNSATPKPGRGPVSRESEAAHEEAETRHRRIRGFLDTLRQSHEHMRGVFRLGGCYELYRILRSLEPEAEPWYIDGHVYTRIGCRWYDIDGEWRPRPEEEQRIEPLFARKRKPWKWRNRPAERRRGFRTRQLGAIRIGWHLRWRMAASRLKIALARLLLPVRTRRELFRAILLRTEAEAIRVYEAGTKRAEEYASARGAKRATAARRRRRRKATR